MQPAPAAKKRSALPLLLLLTEVAYIATYLVSMGLNGWAFEDLKLNPMAGGSAATLSTLGAVDYDEVVYHHQWWRFLAAPFVCSGKQSLQVSSFCMHALMQHLSTVQNAEQSQLSKVVPSAGLQLTTCVRECLTYAIQTVSRVYNYAMMYAFCCQEIQAKPAPSK